MYCPTGDIVANMLTKPLERTKLVHFVNMNRYQNAGLFSAFEREGSLKNEQTYQRLSGVVTPR